MQINYDDILRQIGEDDLFEARFELYRDKGNLALLRMVVTSSENMQQKVTLSDYGSYLFVRKCMTGLEISSLFNDLDRQVGSCIHIPGATDAVSCLWSPSSTQYEFQKLARGQWHGFQRRNYPAKFYQSYEGLEKTHTHLQDQVLNGPGLPYFRSLTEAETYYLFDTLPENANIARPVLQIVIDDKRAWIEQISVGDTGLQILISGDYAEKCEVKLSGKHPGFVRVMSADEAMNYGVPLDVLPAELHVYLSLDTEIVDFRFISEKASSLYAPTLGISYDRDEKVSIEGIIRLRGEGIHHDYKVTFTPNIYSTVCAFANTEGGSIIIGVDDTGNINGVDDPDRIRLQIENFLEDNVEGTIERRYNFHSLHDSQGHEVVVLELRVEEAPVKPVAIREKGKEKYYIRRDGSNRPMKREHHVQMINKEVQRKNSQTSLLTNPWNWIG